MSRPKREVKAVAYIRAILADNARLAKENRGLRRGELSRALGTTRRVLRKTVQPEQREALPPGIDPIFERPVEDLELSVRSVNHLQSADVRTVGELVQKNEAEMLKISNLGRRSLGETKEILMGMGLHLGMSVEEIAAWHSEGSQDS